MVRQMDFLDTPDALHMIAGLDMLQLENLHNHQADLQTEVVDRTPDLVVEVGHTTRKVDHIGVHHFCSCRMLKLVALD